MTTGLTECPNSCGSRVGRRKESVDRHRRLCRLEPMECPFSEVGCTASPFNGLSRQNYSEHMSTSLEAHLKLVADQHLSSTGVRSVVSPLEKLRAVTEEVALLDEMLGRKRVVPALECIKTQLRLPELWLHRAGDCCTFRASNPRETWYSPAFYYGNGAKMCLAVRMSSNIGDHKDVNVTVSLIRMMAEPTVSKAGRSLNSNGHRMPSSQEGQGLKVALLQELNESGVPERHSFTWLFSERGRGDDGNESEGTDVDVGWGVACSVCREHWSISLRDAMEDSNSLVFQVSLVDTCEGLE